MPAQNLGWTPAQEQPDDPFWPEPAWEQPLREDIGRPTLPSDPPAEPKGWVPTINAASPPAEQVPSIWAVLRSGRLTTGRRGVLALMGIGVVAAVIAAVVLLRARPSEQPVAAPVVVSRVAATAGATLSAGPPVVVAISGKVRRPGLLRLPGGSRVDDALRAAGGMLPGTDASLLNPARRLVDGELVLVGIAGPAGAGNAGGAVPSGPSELGAGSALDLNAAAVTDFDSLPGIGPVLAQRIVDWRTEHGRFASVDQLRQVSGIGEAKYQSLKPKVRV